MTEPTAAAPDAPAPVLTPADDVGIPNVADITARRIKRQTVLRTVTALAIVLAVSAGVGYKVSLQGAARKESRNDPGIQPEITTARARKEFEATPAAAMLSPSLPASAAALASAPIRVAYTVPKVEHRDDLDGARPIPLAGGSRTASPGGQARPSQPAEDAPLMLAAVRQPARPEDAAAADSSPVAPGDEVAHARQRLRGYQQQLGTLVGTLSKVAGQTSGGAGAAGSPNPLGNLPASLSGLGGSGGLGALGASGTPGVAGERVLGLEKSNTPTVRAGQLRDRSLLMPKGTAFTCTLKTRVVSAVSGLVSCIIARNVYGDDGRVLLVERGSHMDGEYRIASVKPGVTRIPVLWTRIRTPNGITVDLDSPGTGALGESGIEGDVDNRWPERIGAALLLSLIDDAVRIQVAESQAGATTVYGGTMKESTRIAERVLESTINIPPLIVRNQGATVGVYVARDVDFSSVYALRPAEEGQ